MSSCRQNQSGQMAVLHPYLVYDMLLIIVKILLRNTLDSECDLVTTIFPQTAVKLPYHRTITPSYYILPDQWFIVDT